MGIARYRWIDEDRSDSLAKQTSSDQACMATEHVWMQQL